MTFLSKGTAINMTLSRDKMGRCLQHANVAQQRMRSNSATKNFD
jgi:hypothetical protein